jgi:hypothetical protein
MTIDTSVVLKNLEGEAFKDGEKDLTLGLAIASILSKTTKESDPLKIYSLALKFNEGGEVDLTAEDIVVVKEKVKTSDYFTVVAGQILKHLEV